MPLQISTLDTSSSRYDIASNPFLLHLWERRLLRALRRERLVHSVSAFNGIVAGFGNVLEQHSPAVLRLQVHAEGEQSIVVQPGEIVGEVAQRTVNHGSTLPAFFRLCSEQRSQKKIALAVLLHGGRTPQSEFKIPINVDSSSTCGINAQSDLARLIKVTSLIILDEAPMLHRHSIEVMDRSRRSVTWRNHLVGLRCCSPATSDNVFSSFQEACPVRSSTPLSNSHPSGSGLLS